MRFEGDEELRLAVFEVDEELRLRLVANERKNPRRFEGSEESQLVVLLRGSEGF